MSGFGCVQTFALTIWPWPHPQDEQDVLSPGHWKNGRHGFPAESSAARPSDAKSRTWGVAIRKSIGNTWFFPMTTWGGPVNIPLNQPNDNTTLYCLGIWKVWNSIPHWGDCSWVHSIMWLVSSDYLSDWINPPKLGNQFKSQTTVPFQKHSEVGNTHVSCIMYHVSSIHLIHQSI